MKRIYWLIVKQYIGPLIMTFFIVIFVLLMHFIWLYIDDLVGKGLAWNVIVELLFYASSTFVPMALPLAILISSLMTFGNLAERYELVAIKASGVSLRRAMKPLIILSILISLMAFYFSNNIFPVAQLKFSTLLYDVRSKKLSVTFKEGIYDTTLEDYVIRVGKKSKDKNTLYDVMIYDHTKNDGTIRLITADSGYSDFSKDGGEMIFTLFDGFNFEESKDRKKRGLNPFSRMQFRKEIRRFDLSEIQLKRHDEGIFKNSYKMLNLAQLDYARDSLRKELLQKKYRFRSSLVDNYRFMVKLDSARYDTLADSLRIYSDTLFASLNMNDQKIVLEKALAGAKTIRSDIEHNAKTFKNKDGLINRHDIEWHRKFTLSFACIIFFFIGAPLGAIIRKGGVGLPMVISVLFFIIYHIFSVSMEKSVRTGEIDDLIGMWMPSIVLLPVGIMLTLKATTDAPIMDKDLYIKWYNRIFHREQ
ncbi:MAG: LptF/LptG family permease [Bacteroidales bacterium]|nr:LptF/LptG family permease [Bacteroidales bacterium]